MKATPEQRLARTFEQARLKRRLSYAAVRDQVRERIGDATPTENAIAAYHKGDVTKRMNLEVVVALCSIYGVDLRTVAPEMTMRLRALLALVGASDDDPSDGEKRSSFRNPGFLLDARESIEVHSTSHAA